MFWFQKPRLVFEPCTVKYRGKLKNHDVFPDSIFHIHLIFLRLCNMFFVAFFLVSFLYFIFLFFPLFLLFISCLLCFLFMLFFLSLILFYLHIFLLDDSAGIPVVQEIFLKIMLCILHCRRFVIRRTPSSGMGRRTWRGHPGGRRCPDQR